MPILIVNVKMQHFIVKCCIFHSTYKKALYDYLCEYLSLKGLPLLHPQDPLICRATKCQTDILLLLHEFSIYQYIQTVSYTHLCAQRRNFMGKYDTCMKEFLQNKDRFADLFNGCCFQGRQIIRCLLYTSHMGNLLCSLQDIGWHPCHLYHPQRRAGSNTWRLSPPWRYELIKRLLLSQISPSLHHPRTESHLSHRLPDHWQGTEMHWLRPPARQPFLRESGQPAALLFPPEGWRPYPFLSPPVPPHLP